LAATHQRVLRELESALQEARDVVVVKYGFGWRISEHQGRPVVAHTAETRGFRNALVRFPDEKLTVVLLTNRNEGEPYDIAMKIAERMR
jgi:CubicO group peptidase (beta-lactamase class C family)